MTDRYFGMFNPFRQGRWVFGDRTSGFYLFKFAWTPIVRHRMVPGKASTDDPAMADFWAKRRRRGKLPLGKGTLHLLQKQDADVYFCGGLLLHADQEPQPPISGNSGSRSPARRSANTRSPPMQATASRTSPPPHA